LPPPPAPSLSDDSNVTVEPPVAPRGPPPSQFPSFDAASQVVTLLNDWWSVGAPSGDVSKAGVLVHIFDSP
jgi:hypothetical protein